MKLFKLYIPNPQKWIHFYDKVADGKVKLLQSGGSRTSQILPLGSYTPVEKAENQQLAVKAVSPIEQTTLQANSELERENIKPGKNCENKPNQAQTSTKKQRSNCKDWTETTNWWSETHTNWWSEKTKWWSEETNWWSVKTNWWDKETNWWSKKNQDGTIIRGIQIQGTFSTFKMSFFNAKSFHEGMPSEMALFDLTPTQVAVSDIFNQEVCPLSQIFGDSPIEFQISGQNSQDYLELKGKLICVNPFPNKPWILRVCSIRLLKTLWKKEKLFVTRIFSFFHNVFYLFEKLSSIFIKFEIVVCILFQFGKV